MLLSQYEINWQVGKSVTEYHTIG